MKPTENCSSSGKHQSPWTILLPTNAGLRIICRKMHDQIAQTWEGWPRMASAVCWCLLLFVLPPFQGTAEPYFTMFWEIRSTSIQVLRKRWLSWRLWPWPWNHDIQRLQASQGTKRALFSKWEMHLPVSVGCQGIPRICAAICCNPCFFFTSWIKLDLIPTMSLSFR